MEVFILMKNKIAIYLIALILAVTVIPLRPLSAYTTHSLLFLNIPNGVRETGMGETGVSHANGGSAGWWNPALLATEESEIEFQVFRWIADGKGSFGASRFKTGWGGIGAYYFYQGIDGFEARDRPGEAQGTFSVYQSFFAAGTSFNLFNGVDAGLVYKLIYENIYNSTASTNHALDLGLKWTKGAWSAGVSLSNIEVKNQYEEPFPTSGRIGVSHYRELSILDFIFAAEVLYFKDGDGYGHFGVEAGWSNLLFMRTGYMLGHDSRSVSFGAGIKHMRYRADVSITPFTNDLGTVWRAGLGIEI